MKINNLNETVILIDFEFLCKLINKNFNFYKELYPSKDLKIKLTDLIDCIANSGRVAEEGNKVDVVFFFTLRNPIIPKSSIPNDISQFLDSNQNYYFETETAIFVLRSFFSDLEYDIHNSYDGALNYKLEFCYLLKQTVSDNKVSHIVLFADNELVNKDLQSYIETTDKLFFIERDNSYDTNICLDLSKARKSKCYYLDANLIVALAMGISLNEL